LANGKKIQAIQRTLLDTI